ncbi:MAG TPA: hypothetical protein DEP23_12770 [Ruminococcaceae bacterium]|jgi:hypothetical protein|nr:hypothetical protein [Oscillospiraceae bacterium]
MPTGPYICWTIYNTVVIIDKEYIEKYGEGKPGASVKPLPNIILFISFACVSLNLDEYTAIY